jgi:sn-glycerol 3-phosphate transport system permease protein
MSAELAPGFRNFLVLVAVIFVGAIVLGIVGSRAKPATAHTARVVNRYILLTTLAVIAVFPIYITLVNSFLEPDRIAQKPPALFAWPPTGSGYSLAWNELNVSEYLKNSVVVTFVIVAGQIVTGVLAAYAFAFLRFPFKRLLFVLFLTTLMIPFEVVFFTNLQTVATLGDKPGLTWIAPGTYGALTLPFLATGFGAFLVRQSFLSLPSDLRDAAALDGYGHFRFMIRVAVPLARPAVASLALFSFFAAWNQYLWPLVAAGDDHKTIQIGLASLKNTALDQVNATFAGAILAALPLFVLLLIFQKQLVRGLTAGAVKG